MNSEERLKFHNKIYYSIVRSNKYFTKRQMMYIRILLRTDSKSVFNNESIRIHKSELIRQKEAQKQFNILNNIR